MERINSNDSSDSTLSYHSVDEKIGEHFAHLSLLKGACVGATYAATYADEPTLFTEPASNTANSGVHKTSQYYALQQLITVNLLWLYTGYEWILATVSII